ncbi:MAG: DUF2752 domain-containing protein [Verrucomicrobiota bacterium]
MNDTPPEPAPRRWLYALLGSVLLVALGGFYWLDPTQHAIFPPCLFHKLTGWNCPGCGGQRALHQLLHGNVAAAFWLNPMLFLLTPLMAWWGWNLLHRKRSDAMDSPMHLRPAFGWGLLAAVILFTIARNIWQG